MTKVITALIIAAALFIGYEIFVYWDKVKSDEEDARKAAAAKVITSGDQLQGMPYQYQDIYKKAEKQGAAGILAFLKNYGASVQDPRKAWIQLDLCQKLTGQDPAEARRLFAEVKGRTPPDSPVMPRIKQLERTFE